MAPDQLKLKTLNDNPYLKKRPESEITFNSAYAGAVLECKGANDKNVLVPVNIYSKDNPRKYGDLCSGKVKKGDVLSVKGPLISGYYSNGKKKQAILGV